MTPVRDRIVARIEFDTNGGCWLWSGAVDEFGYGRINIDGRNTKAHRTSYREFLGQIPPGLELLHKCDTPCCVNPGHLIPGSHAANMADMAGKGRADSKRGSRNATAKITPELAREIRLSSASAHDLAEQLGLHWATIYRVRRGDHWTQGEVL